MVSEHHYRPRQERPVRGFSGRPPVPEVPRSLAYVALCDRFGVSGEHYATVLAAVDLFCV